MLSREASLDDYRQTIGRATTLLDELKDAVAGDAELAELVAAARAAQRGWVKTDAEPSITLMEAGKRTRAIKETSSAESWAAYDAMTAATGALHQSLNDTRDEAADAVASFTQRARRLAARRRPHRPARARRLLRRPAVVGPHAAAEPARGHPAGRPRAGPHVPDPPGRAHPS